MVKFVYYNIIQSYTKLGLISSFFVNNTFIPWPKPLSNKGYEISLNLWENWSLFTLKHFHLYMLIRYLSQLT
jgi:hypothetical protein